MSAPENAAQEEGSGNGNGNGNNTITGEQQQQLPTISQVYYAPSQIPFQTEIQVKTARKRKPKCRPMRFRCDPFTGILWPEFWLPRIISSSSSSTTAALFSAAFILVPLRVLRNGFLGVLPQHQNQAAFIVSLSEGVFSGLLCQAMLATDQDRLLRKVARSPLTVKNSSALMNVFMAMVNSGVNKAGANMISFEVVSSQEVVFDEQLNGLLIKETDWEVVMQRRRVPSVPHGKAIPFEVMVPVKMEQFSLDPPPSSQ